MSLIKRIEITNFLDSKGRDEWAPDIAWETLDLAAKSTIILAPNGTCKTSLTLAIFALLTRKKSFIKQVKSKMSPKGARSNMSHVRIEFFRPHDRYLVQRSLDPVGMPISGDTWVFGICGHNDNSDKLIYYFFRGTFDTVPLAFAANDVITLIPDPDIADSVKAAPEGIYDVGSDTWKSLIGDHIPRRQLDLLQQFQNKGGGDHNAPLFPVIQKGAERYDEAFFYQHVVPQLVSGIHRPDPEDSDGDAGAEESLEETLVKGSYGLLQNKHDLEKTKARLDATQGTFNDLRSLSEHAGAINTAEAAYKKALGKVAEVGAALRAVLHSGLPGLPVMVLHGDAQVNKLLEHMAISPGEDVYLRAPGMDGVINSARDVYQILRDFKLRSSKISQVVEIVTQEHMAKISRAPQSGRYLSEADAVEFIKKVPETYLRDSAGDVAAFRAQKIEIVKTAFGHFRKRIDTSPHRRHLALLAQKTEAMRGAGAGVAKRIAGGNEEKAALEAGRQEREGVRAAWRQMFASELFSPDEIANPAAAEKDLNVKRKELRDSIEILSENINRIGSAQDALIKFRKQYPGREPLDVSADLQARRQDCRKRLTTTDNALESLDHERCRCRLHAKKLEIHREELRQSAAALEMQEKSLAKLHQAFPGMSVTEIAASLDDNERALQDEFVRLQKALQTSQKKHDEFEVDAKRQIKDADKETQFIRTNFETQAEGLRNLFPDLEALDVFKEQYGPEADPEAIKAARQEKLQKLEPKTAKIEKSTEEQARYLSALEQKKLAPGKISNLALSNIPGDLDYSLLHQTIESSGMSSERKAQALKLFSPLIFSPVVKTPQDAARLAEIFDAKKLPVPVFLEPGLTKLLSSGDFSGLEDVVCPYLGEMADILLHPEKLENARKVAEKRLRNLKARHEVLLRGTVDLSPRSPASMLIRNACDSVTRGSEAGARDLAKKILAAAGASIPAFEGLRTFLRERSVGTQSNDVESHGLLNEFPGAGDEERRQAWLLSAEKTFAGRVEKLVLLRNRLEDEVKRTKEKFAQEKHLQDEAISQAEATLAEFRAKCRGQGDVAQDLARATGYDQKKHAEIKDALGKVEFELKEEAGMATEIEEERDRGRQKRGDEKLLLQGLRHQAESFNFEALAAFIASDEGKNVSVLVDERSKQHKSLDDIDKKLRFQFCEAQKYVSVKAEDENAERRIGEIKKNLGELAQQEAQLNEQVANLLAVSEKVRGYSRSYDSSLVDIQREMKHFAQILADVGDLADVGESEGALSLKQSLAGILSEEAGPESRELVDAIAELSTNIAKFESFDKARRAKDRQKDRDNALIDFQRECGRFIKENRGRVSESVLLDVEAAKAKPSLIQSLLEILSANVAEERGVFEKLSWTYQHLWDKQVGRIVGMSEKAEDNFKLLKRVCAKHGKNGEATFYFDAKLATKDDIERLVHATRDKIEIQSEKQRIELDKGNITKKQFEDSIKKGDFLSDVRKQFYKIFFGNPSIKFTHSHIRCGQKIDYSEINESKISGGQRVALQLLMVVRLAEFAKERDMQSSGRSKSARQAQTFVLLDGMLSSLSDDKLINESLNALQACQGVFQLVGLIHNKGYVNNFNIFPSFIVARRYVEKNDPHTKGRWVRFEKIEKDENMGFWHAQVVAGGSENQMQMTETA
ncbi:coiled-coil domain-containing protein [Desulfonatronum thiodismutans]|uniref:hypothetical protein n=1 Tax=Desulfonatronum thiodismutans TaxID=159290 RepID=UPI0004ABDDE1|nr:hypothetical protein [Desulfonatronum thiodismutans]